MSAEPSSNLRELVQKYGVAIEHRAAFTMSAGHRVPIGFDVNLYGAHDGEHGPKPGEAECLGCAEVWEHLREIVAGVVSASGDGAAVYRVDPYRPGVIIATRRKGKDGRNREDVELVLEIRASGEQVPGMEPCDEKCVQPIIDGLRELGAHEG